VLTPCHTKNTTQQADITTLAILSIHIYTEHMAHLAYIPPFRGDYTSFIFKALASMKIIKMTAFWDVAQYSLMEADIHLRGAYYLHHQGIYFHETTQCYSAPRKQLSSPAAMRT
jgi:hypothetical protein